MKKPRGAVPRLPDPAHERRAALARKIALFIGSAERRATEIPGLTLHLPDRSLSMAESPAPTTQAEQKECNEKNSLPGLHDRYLRLVSCYFARGSPVTHVDVYPAGTTMLPSTELLPKGRARSHG